MHTIDEVFPSVRLPEKLKQALSDATVEKITATASRDKITIYLRSGHVIAKRDILKFEQELTHQIIGRRDGKIRVRERFVMPEDITSEQIWKQYSDSVVTDLTEKNRLFCEVLFDSEVTFPGPDCFQIALPKTVFAEAKENEIRRYFRELFTERFGCETEIRISYRKPVTSEEEKIREEKLAASVEQALKELSQVRAEAKKNETKKPVQDPSQKAGQYRKARKKADATNLLYGKPFDGEATPLSEIVAEAGEVVVRGEIILVEERQLRNEKTLMTFVVSDDTDSISGKVFVREEDLDDMREVIREGNLVCINGYVDIDKFDREFSIQRVFGIKGIDEFRKKRSDDAPVKRVELHCHTKMSDMDGLTSPEDIVKGAVKMGHHAVAITDHGVVHGFPEAYKTLNKLRDKGKAPEDFKILYGMEGYVVDDRLDLVVNGKGQDFSVPFVVVDLETTGFSAEEDAIIEIGAVRVENGVITDRMDTFVFPKRPIPYRITELTSITDAQVADAPPIEEALPAFLEFSKGGVFVAHNAGFDLGFLKKNAERLGLAFDPTYLDTVAMARILLPEMNRFKLDAVAKKLGVSLENHHRAVDDAECTAQIFLKFLPMLAEREILSLADLAKVKLTPDVIKKLKTHHIILFAKNEEGRKNLYRLVSRSHLDYFAKRPRLPKSLITEKREGLLIGSACVSGELFDALLSERSEQQIEDIVSFYDYLEVQPLANNRFLLQDSRYPKIRTDEDLIALNKRIIELGEKYDKPVVATCDVHFFHPEDEICRRIILAGNGFKNVDRPEPLYFRTTKEMLEEFSYLDPQTAEKIVITNTNRIADEIESIAPVRPDKCPPVIENSDGMLKDLVYSRAHEIYGEELAKPVSARLEKELDSIIRNGYAVLYIIAQKLVKKSNDDGYLVGSRGSVGSSLVAFMAGITEVNSLAPHYYCPHCHYSDFDSDAVKPYLDKCGLDMPDRNCPVCGKPLEKDGWNIPFETFLGFKGDKEPDIDLNFSGEYQGIAHRYTEVIFGKGHTFKAGTIATVADKTTYGYVMHYFEDRGVPKRRCELNRIVDKCKGVRKSTGQHPGGIIVLPHGEEIDTFTPVQHPANDTKTDIITTHFDYHSIDSNLLKLDILGHDDPTMVRRLEDLTGVPVKEIPLDDEMVFSLFHNTEALGIAPEQIHGCKLGCLGIPEFGTDFVIQIVREADPKTFADLIRISGLSHGTNVWLDNAQTLIREGTCDISSAICTRDDIMTYLINTGMDKALSFKIMEAVRKGRGLTPENEAAMVEAGVPEWYIWSCKRISYMFPKAHAVAYVTMALRIAYCKVHYPLAYYAAYFAIRASAFSYEVMCQGPELLSQTFDRLEHQEVLSQKEEAMLKDMRIVEEMYARGFTFMPIDVYRASPKDFEIIDGKIMPSLMSIDGMGEKAALSLSEAAREAPFLSKEDVKTRGKVSKTIVDKMSDLHLLDGLPESDQLSIFDLAR